ncbi:hypothetical protein D6850_09085 [Roseovarius spongiae]|uniref:Endonuclease n=1 Tax=Roseovarius spongiae TaxID=2320272 RepID=A0A3A8B9R2_9RHOB|nr:hypothetical protein [Roseovarius spongiae]RKF15003.1 hypothetical protein D6850_09085 [Roseovarius spongiae]
MSDLAATCRKTCWGFALAVGIAFAVLLFWAGGYGWFSSLLTGIIVCFVCGFLFTYLFCSGPGVSGAETAATPAAPRIDEPAATPAAESPAAAAPGRVPPGTVTPAKTPEPPKEAVPQDAPGAAAETASDVAETGAQDKPETLEAPRDGKGDNLKLIKGVGPKLEALLNRLGFYHFDQIAAWSDREVAWVDENLEGFRGRVSRDNWVAQAKTLADGGETEFSRRSRGGK